MATIINKSLFSTRIEFMLEQLYLVQFLVFECDPLSSDCVAKSVTHKAWYSGTVI